MEKKDLKNIGHGKKEVNNICNRYIYSEKLNFIRPFDEVYRKINENNFKEINELIPTYMGKRLYIL